MKSCTAHLKGMCTGNDKPNKFKRLQMMALRRKSTHAFGSLDEK